MLFAVDRFAVDRSSRSLITVDRSSQSIAHQVDRSSVDLRSSRRSLITVDHSRSLKNISLYHTGNLPCLKEVFCQKSGF
ncbi:MAG: hypothetical protein ACM65L_13120 [Microcoleus sp.]